MSIFSSALSSVGIGGVLTALNQCDSNDREIVMPVLDGIIPRCFSELSIQKWRATILRIATTILFDFESTNIVILGPELTLVEALAAIKYEGAITIVPSPNISKSDFDLLERNLPHGSRVTVLQPNHLPELKCQQLICTLVVEAGGGYFLTQESAAQSLGAILGRHFTGEVVALMPRENRNLNERLENWQHVPKSNFTQIYDQNGSIRILPTIQ